MSPLECIIVCHPETEENNKTVVVSYTYTHTHTHVPRLKQFCRCSILMLNLLQFIYYHSHTLRVN